MKSRKNNELDEAINTLSKAVKQESSDDGLVTLVFTGAGEFKEIRINGALEDLDKGILEDAILNCLERSRERMSTDIYSVLLDFLNKENQEKEDFVVDIEDVS